MPTLRSQLDALASSFANAIVDAIRGASLQDLLAAEGMPARNGGRRRAINGVASAAPAAPRHAGRPSRGGRLRRRSAADIGRLLNEIVELLKTKKDGLRAEQIRSELGLQSKELPRILKEGLSSKKLRKTGQKRATVYTAK
ncbi:MAG: hypothetical protein ACREJ3_03470 [Polyangiaceae bacterium]